MPLFWKSTKIASPVSQESPLLPTCSDEKLCDRFKTMSEKDRRLFLHGAASSGHAEVVRALIEQGYDLNIQDKQLGYTPLHKAAANGHIEVVGMLVDSGAATDRQDYAQENTPLHEAAAKGHVSVLKLLIDGHSNLYIRNKSGATALHLASQYGRATTAKMLLQHGCKSDVKDKYDDSPLHTSVRYLHSGASKALLQNEANPNEQNKNGDTPLHLACNLGQKKLAKLLLEYGASLSIRNNQGETAVDIAARKQCPELVELVKSATISNTQLKKSRTHKSGTSWKGRERKTKIRQRLESARNAGSNWHLLFQDFESAGDDLMHRNPRLRLPLLRKGQQHYVDLAGKIHKGSNTTKTPVTCYCSPFFYRLAKQNNVAHQELLDEIDACHHELSHEISDLRQVTERRLADLHRDLKNGRFGSMESVKGDSKLQRWHSESELETDIERGRLQPSGSPDSNESLSNASDDIYIERYWCNEKVKRSPSVSKKSTNTASNRSTKSKKSQGTKGTFGTIQECFEESIRQFNRIDLDDSCTTPTSASSQPYTASLTSRSQSAGTGAHLETDSTGSHRASIYSCHSGDGTGPQPPSLDSGYGTGTMGMSPSPATFSCDSIASPSAEKACRSLLPALNEVATQTEGERNDSSQEHEYTELELSVRAEKPCTPRMANRVRPSPRLTIPPPPTKPLPPVPKPKPRINRQNNCFSTNV